ncbi:hypothetical protein bpr_II064 (plasmid) [Butyrivibrio proteoclasticus B316]|uniref:Uncharacterized protein n=1 Tax=Butyrivibrio proteoclasticus (strain ATCC 51982 / DSM 14932 / B316) TaxID=515622 RepID=E0S3M2_BUTPB|nr:hypothetical protein [Butyrivibrio proteoclasticus]ADL36004.1 hypothetical protein bpr_II064 [Butyrivibrio proteoclasticus B316]
MNATIKYEAHETRTNVFGMMAKKLEPWLLKNKIEYKIVKEKDIPDDWAHGCIFQGKPFMKHYVCVVSKLNSDWLLQFVDELGNMPDSEYENLIN